MNNWRSPGLAARLHREDAFTLIELLIVIMILGIILTIATLSYASISEGININGAKKQLEAAMSRAKNAARQENVTYQLRLYTDADPVNGNSYEFMHSEMNLAGVWTMTPVDKSVAGEETSGNAGHTFIKMGNSVKIAGCDEIAGSTIVISFTPAGTEMSIQGSDDPEVGLPPTTSEVVTINLQVGDKTGSIAIDGTGRITVN